MRIRNDQHRLIDLRTLSDAELRTLAFEGQLSKADLVAVVNEMRQRTRHRGRSPAPREHHDTPSPR